MVVLPLSFLSIALTDTKSNEIYYYKLLRMLKRKVYFYIVGDGAVRIEYEKIVVKYQIQKYCIFKGVRTGKELDDIYNMCDIGIEMLAVFRK